MGSPLKGSSAVRLTKLWLGVMAPSVIDLVVAVLGPVDADAFEVLGVRASRNLAKSGPASVDSPGLVIVSSIRLAAEAHI